MGYQLRAGPRPPPPLCSASLKFVFLCWRSATLTATDLGDRFMSLPKMPHTNVSHPHPQNTWHFMTTSYLQVLSSHFSPRLLKHWLCHHGVTDGAIQGCFLGLVSPGSRAGPLAAAEVTKHQCPAMGPDSTERPQTQQHTAVQAAAHPQPSGHIYSTQPQHEHKQFPHGKGSMQVCQH